MLNGDTLFRIHPVEQGATLGQGIMHQVQQHLLMMALR